MKRLLLIAIVGVIFGAVTAYFGAQIFNSIGVDSERPQNHWYDGFMLLMSPGAFLDHKVFPNAVGFGPYEDVIEGGGLRDAMLFNALGLMFITAVIACLIWSIKWTLRAIMRAHHSHAR